MARPIPELAPDLADAYSNLGSVLCDLKQDYDGAITNFRKAIELYPNDRKPLV